MANPSTAALLEQPHDTCVRCGKPTPLGVALCDDDNPGKIKGPSSTQVHGTVAVGLIAGFLLLFVVLTRVTTPAAAGELAATIPSTIALADGSTQIVVRVTNNSAGAAAANCRVQRGGSVGAGDIEFFTEQIPPGATREYNKVMPPPAADSPISSSQAATFAVRCN